MQFLKGHLLVSVPDLLDPNFLQSVTLLVEHTDEGALGLVLNRPTTNNIGEIWEQLTQRPCELDSLIHQGGPCEGLLSVLHCEPKLACSTVFEGLYFTQEPDRIEQLIDQKVRPARFFVGYAGWGPGQLEAEFADGSWLTTPALVDDIFSDEEELWKQLRTRISHTRWWNALKIRNVPDDPSVN
jgi:putative transcriptional regulator